MILSWLLGFCHAGYIDDIRFCLQQYKLQAVVAHSRWLGEQFFSTKGQSRKALDELCDEIAMQGLSLQVCISLC
jgi:hypothetical protein